MRGARIQNSKLLLCMYHTSWREMPHFSILSPDIHINKQYGHMTDCLRSTSWHIWTNCRDGTQFDGYCYSLGKHNWPAWWQIELWWEIQNLSGSGIVGDSAHQIRCVRMNAFSNIKRVSACCHFPKQTDRQTKRLYTASGQTNARNNEHYAVLSICPPCA